MPFQPRAPRAIFRRFSFIAAMVLLAASTVDASAQGRNPNPVDRQLNQLREHTEAALARGDLRAAEMLMETYVSAVQRHPDPTWHRFNGHLVACRIKLAMDKPDEAAQHAAELAAIAARSKRTDTMEYAIAAIMGARVRLKQGRSAEAADQARAAIVALRRAFERGRITRRTFDTELLAYEDVLIEATTGRTVP